MNDIEKALLEAFEETQPGLASSLKELRKLNADKRTVIQELDNLKHKQLIYQCARLYIDHLWEGEQQRDSQRLKVD